MARLCFHSHLFIFFVLLVFCHDKIALSIPSYFKSEPEKTIKSEFIYLEVESMSELQCAGSCAKNGSCSAASFDETTGLCKLSGFRAYEKGQSNHDRIVTVGSQWTTLSRKGCLDSWVNIDDTCYYFYSGPVDYNDAKGFCAQKDSKLAEPPTFTSFELLQNYTFQVGGEAYFIGLNDIETEGQFVWTSNGAVPQYSGWNDTGRYNTYHANCISMWDGAGYSWADTFCMQKIGAICEEIWY